MKCNLKLCRLNDLQEKVPAHYSVKEVDLVVIKYGNEVSVLYGRCLHRGALLADGHIEGKNLICGLHGWDYRYDTGVSEYNNAEALQKFNTAILGDEVFINDDEIDQFLAEHPQPFQRDDYQGVYADTQPEDTEPYTLYIKELAKNGLKNVGHHGFISSMGVNFRSGKISSFCLPNWPLNPYLMMQK